MGKKELIEEIKKVEWIEWSCGRSTDYANEFWEEGSIENLIELVNKLKPTLK